MHHVQIQDGRALVLFSVTLGGVILSVQKLTWILYFLIPNFGMYVRVDLPESAGLSPVIAYMILTVISIIICAISYTRLKKMDLT